MSIAGSISVTAGGGTVTSDVSGSGYSLPSNFDPTKLDGTYVYGGKTRAATTTTNSAYSTSIGTYNIAGSTVTVCPSSFYFTSAPTCRDAAGASVPPLALTASWDSAISALRLKDSANKPYGIVQVHAGDRGPVMLIDIAYASTSASTSTSTSTSTYGAYYGIKTSTLAGAEGNGTWKRADGLATATVSGSNVSVAYSGVSSVAPFSLTYNSILQGSSLYSYNGFFRGHPRPQDPACLLLEFRCLPRLF